VVVSALANLNYKLIAQWNMHYTFTHLQKCGRLSAGRYHSLLYALEYIVTLYLSSRRQLFRYRDHCLYLPGLTRHTRRWIQRTAIASAQIAQKPPTAARGIEFILYTLTGPFEALCMLCVHSFAF
jgi:hypothetical protein